MALPVAHWAVAQGVTTTRDWRVRLFLAILVLLPDFDFALVWGLGLPVEIYHRTFSHSLAFFLVLTVFWARWQPGGLGQVSPALFVVVLSTHSLMDLLCTADAADHGVMLFWPFSDQRFGWSVLVPLYRLFAESPFTLPGALRFTLLELALAVPLWAGTLAVRLGIDGTRERLAGRAFGR